MKTRILLIAIYLLSVLGSYKFVQYAYYDPHGRWIMIKPEVFDILICVFPVANSFFALGYLNNDWMDNKYKSRTIFSFPEKTISETDSIGKLK